MVSRDVPGANSQKRDSTLETVGPEVFSGLLIGRVSRPLPHPETPGLGILRPGSGDVERERWMYTRQGRHE
jgi:hypothetical protein